MCQTLDVTQCTVTKFKVIMSVLPVIMYIAQYCCLLVS